MSYFLKLKKSLKIIFFFNIEEKKNPNFLHYSFLYTSGYSLLLKQVSFYLFIYYYFNVKLHLLHK